MMYWYGDGGGWHPWIAALMWIGMILFWALVVFGVVWLVRSTAQQKPREPQPPDPERILQDRFARGEIDAEEYRRRMEVLGKKTPVGTG